MTNFKTLFAAALLSSVAAVSFAKAPTTSKNGESANPTAVTATTSSKAKLTRHKPVRSVKINSKARHAVHKQKTVRDSKASNSKGPGLEAY